MKQYFSNPFLYLTTAIITILSSYKFISILYLYFDKNYFNYNSASNIDFNNFVLPNFYNFLYYLVLFAGLFVGTAVSQERADKVFEIKISKTTDLMYLLNHFKNNFNVVLLAILPSVFIPFSVASFTNLSFSVFFLSFISIVLLLLLVVAVDLLVNILILPKYLTKSLSLVLVLFLYLFIFEDRLSSFLYGNIAVDILIYIPLTILLFLSLSLVLLRSLREF